MKKKRPTPNVQRPTSKSAKKAPRRRRSKTGLSTRQEKFCLIHASGKTATEAYRHAYGVTKGAEASGSRLLTIAKVSARVAAIQQAAAVGAVLTLSEKRKLLRGFAMNEEPSTVRDRIRAIELDARFANELEPAPQVNVSGDVNLLVTPELLAALQARRSRALRYSRAGGGGEATRP